MNGKRICALLLAGAMSLSLAACGDKEEKAKNEAKTLAQELGYGYLSEYSELNAELNWINSNNVSTAQGKLYFSGDYYDEETGTSGTKLYCSDPETGETTEIPVAQPQNGENVNEYTQAVSVSPDGGSYWMIVDRYTFDDSMYSDMMDEDLEGSALEDEIMPREDEAEGENPDAEIAAEEPAAEEPAAEEPATDPETEEPPEDAGTEDAAADVAEALPEEEDSTVEDMGYIENQEQYFARKYDMNGTLLTEIDLTNMASEEEYFYPQSVTQNGAGDLLISSDSGIIRFGADGSQKETIDMKDQYIQNMVASEDGTVLVSYYDVELNKTVLCKVEDQGLSEPIEINGVNLDMGGRFYSGSGSTLMFTDGTLLYSLDLNSGEATKMLSWLDSDINGSNLSGVAASGEDKILVLMQEYHNDGQPTYELGVMTKTPAEELPQRTILTMGALYLDQNLQKAVINFNRKSETYRITLVDYSQYNTNEDYSAGGEQMDRDIISGNCPDIISLSTGHEAKYIAKGVLADLSAMIEKDESLSMEDLVAGPLKAYTVDGKLYGLPMSFSMETLLASAKLVGDRDSWTLSELAQVVDGLEEGVKVTQYHSQTSFLTSMVRNNLSQYVDFGKAQCSFNSEEFKALLALSAKLPTQEQLDIENGVAEAGDGMATAMAYQDPYAMLQSGDLLMTEEYLSGDSYSLKTFYGVYNEENGFKVIGYPQTEGNGAQLMVDGGLAISAKSKYQDGAWEFVKTILDDSVQKDVWSFPVTASALDEKLQEATEKEYYMENGEKVYTDDSYTYVGDTEYKITPLTQEQLENLKEMINGAAIAGSYDEDIDTIITEESAAYFSGDKTADEVADLIQNRVTIYLGETS